MNHCRMRFSCIVPYNDVDSSCDFYKKKEEECKGIKYNKCKWEYMGDCINSDAQREALRERGK